MENFEKLSVIGHGAYGTCYLCQAKNDRFRHRVVIKTVYIQGRQKDTIDIQKEAQVLYRLAHPNIISFYNSFVDKSCLHIVMEYAEGGTLDQLIRDQKNNNLSEDMILYYFTQITMALDYIHSKKIIHRDLKTQNILLNRKRTIVKLADFGIARELHTRDLASTMIGTPNYLSPEICEGRGYDSKTDLWSLGCILYELIELKRAFDGDNFPSVVLKITTGKVEPMSRPVSDKLRELVNVLLSINEKKRPTAKEILTSPLVLPKCLELHLDLGRIDWPSSCQYADRSTNLSTTLSSSARMSTNKFGLLTTATVKGSLPLDFYLNLERNSDVKS